MCCKQPTFTVDYFVENFYCHVLHQKAFDTESWCLAEFICTTFTLFERKTHDFSGSSCLAEYH